MLEVQWQIRQIRHLSSWSARDKDVKVITPVTNKDSRQRAWPRSRPWSVKGVGC